MNMLHTRKKKMNYTVKTPKEKMNWFLAKMLTQIIVFSILVAGVAYNINWAAITITWYAGFIVCGILGGIFVILIPKHLIIAGIAANKFSDIISPTNDLARFISFLFTLVEFGILASVGWYWLATIWVVGTISEYFMITRIKYMSANYSDEIKVQRNAVEHE